MEYYISFELAKKLKEEGFPQNYSGGYNMVGACYFEDGRFYKDGCIANIEDCFTAPTIAQTLKWFRNTHKLFISPCVIADYQDDFHRDTTYWSFIVVNIECGDSIYREYERVTEKRFDSYEQAALAGIEYVLDNLI